MLLANSCPLATPWLRGVDTRSLVHSWKDRLKNQAWLDPESKLRAMGRELLPSSRSRRKVWALDGHIPFGPVDSSPPREGHGQRRARVLESSKAHSQVSYMTQLVFSECYTVRISSTEVEMKNRMVFPIV